MIISKLSQEQIDKFSNALSLLVPYYRYSSSDEGIQKIKSIIIDPLSLSPIIDPSAPVGTQEDCVVDLKRFLQFIKENWDSNTINAIQLLNEHVLNVIFKGVLSTQNITAKSIGFSGLPPYTFYHIIIEFFYGLTGSKFDFVKFLSYNRNSLLLLGISGLSITYKNQADLISSIEILIYIYCSNYYIEILQNDDPNFAYNVCNTFISLLTYVYSDDSNFQSNSKFTTSSFVFVGEYVKTITQFFGEEKAIDIIVQLFTDNPSHITSLGFIMMNLLNHYISNKNWSNIVWEKLVYLIVKSDALSAITAHYAQYLAVYSFPYEFEINFEEAREACTNHKRRKQRTRQSTPHDYIAENFEMIVKKPEEFVHKNIKAYYEPFNQYEKMISKIQIIPLTFSDKQNIKTLLISFLDTFSNYKTFETPNQEENCFAIIISFCQMFVQLRLIPTTIQYNRSAPYALCSRRLFNSILTQNNQQIRKMSFSILSDLINHIEIEPYLTNIDYSNWYASLILMMLSRFEECREMGFQASGTPVNVPVTTTNENIIPSIENEYEKEFNDVFNQLLSDYKEEFKEESFETDIFPTDDYHLNSIIEEIDNNTEITSNDDNTIKLPYPVIIPTNSIAGALTACGRYPLNHPENFFHLDPNTSATIEKLQKETHRLGVKIGVVYVGPNVENQNQILATTIEETSTHFKEFILGLGWPIELRTHSGYDGGMDLNRNGTTSIYYSDFLDEIMFHIAPLIPTDYKDEQQIYKKRHIGNDHIHIVWCEQGKDYDITTITSQFNKAHIVIYPLNTGLFHVDIHWRNEELGWFGPLRYSIVVNKTILPALVRETSVSAMKSFYFSQELTRFATPQNEIAKTVATVIPKCDKKKEKKEQDKSVSLEPLEALMNIEPQN
ncbi:Rap/ran-GAP family protein [Histomonas meleagridis]|uniref:Rap/ran-GAP family protein n=1 Tax=Histomonas meleagridis TaxID=135588 RepID=UPI0035597469|nr:Rap/ran-GAP family protein [Histomonas meleagridis]KAH0803644.1 Rap/ran-GAP family protein [Histomonas meleagridis]